MIRHDRDFKFEPVGLGQYDTVRQRFTAFVLYETDTEFVCLGKYNGGEFVLPKYAWRIYEPTVQSL